MTIPTHILVAITGWMQRGVGIVCQLLCIRLVVEGLGVEAYSTFAVLVTIFGWCSLMDFGLAGSLQNYISERRGKGDSYEQYIACTWLLSVLLWVIALLLLFFLKGPLAHLLLSPFLFLSAGERVSCLLVVALLAITWSISIISFRIWVAEHKGYVPAIALTIAPLIATWATWLITKTGLEPKLSLYLISTFGPMTVLASGFHLFLIPRVVAALRKIDRKVAREVMQRGLFMWLISFLGICCTQTDLFLVSRVMTDPKDIVVYSFAQRIFSVVYLFYNGLMLSLIPVMAEMLHAQKRAALKAMFTKYIALGIGAILTFSICSPLFMPLVTRFLSPRELVSIPYPLALLFGVSIVCRVWSDSFCALLMSANQFRFFFVWLPVTSVISIAAELLLGMKAGLTGIVLGMIVGMLSTVVWSAPKALGQLLRQARPIG